MLEPPSRAIVSVAVALGLTLAPLTGSAAPPVELSAEDEPVEVAAEPPDELVDAGEPDPLPNVEDEPGEQAEPAPPPAELNPASPPAPALDDDPEPDFDDDEFIDDDDEFIDDDYDSLRDSPEALAARRWIGAGIGATITGAVLVGGAIAMSQTAACDPAAGNNCFADARDRAAVTMGVPGGVLLLGGIAMTVVGALHKRRLAASFALAPGQLGLAVSGRF
ncbi:hypothetical protein [Enhygromyxa salina]|nr:hypothetical protein [Enhygromyxa salina]